MGRARPVPHHRSRAKDHSSRVARPRTGSRRRPILPNPNQVPNPNRPSPNRSNPNPRPSPNSSQDVPSPNPIHRANHPKRRRANLRPNCHHARLFQRQRCWSARRTWLQPRVPAQKNASFRQPQLREM